VRLPEPLSRRRFLGALPIAGAARCLRLTPTRSAETDAPLLEVICRDGWGARPPAGAFVAHDIDRLTVHHSAVVLRDNREAPGRFCAYQRGHLERGWPDIAYHVLIDRNGNVYKARPSWARGDTATSYDPSGHLLVLCDGSFREQPVSRAQVRALVRVLAWACRRFDVAPRTIGAHRDYVATACPGTDLYALIADGTIRRRVRKRLADGGVTRTRLCGRAGHRRVEAIERGDA
jgi:hypothetical protein